MLISITLSGISVHARIRRMLMKQAGDTLAGRIGILRMYSPSDKEIEGKADDITCDWSFKSLKQKSLNLRDNNIVDVYRRIWEGGICDLSLSEIIFLLVHVRNLASTRCTLSHCFESFHMLSLNL